MSQSIYMKFQSKKDILFSIIILAVTVFMVGITIFEIISGENYLALILTNTAVIGFLFWVYFGTNYKLSEENELIYRSGPLRGRISVDRITEIIVGKTLWVGFRPATSRNGLIIKYDKYNEIYISPKTNELFIEKILELNGEIKISSNNIQ